MDNEISFKNTFGITKITLTKKIHAYCRLGGDWYTNNLTITFTPVDEIPDYVYLDEAIEEACEQQNLIIEEVIDTIYKIIKFQAPSAINIRVTSYVNDSVPKNMFVQVEKEG